MKNRKEMEAAAGNHKQVPYGMSVRQMLPQIEDCLAPFVWATKLRFLSQRFGHRCAHAKGVMWSDVIVLPEPLVDDDLRLPGRCEPFGVEQLAAQRAVESLRVRHMQARR